MKPGQTRKQDLGTGDAGHPHADLWARVLARSPAADSTIHGPDHWARVERNGLFLCRHVEASVKVVRLFALFHDCQRLHDGQDPGHGARGAAHAQELQSEFTDLTGEEMGLLYTACREHTSTIHVDNPTLAVCFDADRLDIGRVLRAVDPSYLNTEPARWMAATGDFEELHRMRPRDLDGKGGRF